MSEPFFTVLVTAHDPSRKQYLIQALQSALDQDFEEDYEIILVKDYMDEQVDSFVNMHRLISIYTHEKFIGPKLKLGCERAQGKYIAFLEDDDLFEKNKLSQIHFVLNQGNQITLLKHDVNLIGSVGESLPNEDFEDFYYFPRSNYIDKTFNIADSIEDYFKLASIFVNPSTMVCKKDCLIDNLSICGKIQLIPDLFIFACFLTSTGNAKFIVEKLGSYRIHESTANLSTASSKRKSITVEIFYNDHILISSLYSDKGLKLLHRKQLSIASRMRLWSNILEIRLTGRVKIPKLNDIGYVIFGQPSVRTFKNAIHFIPEIIISLVK